MRKTAKMSLTLLISFVACMIVSLSCSAVNFTDMDGHWAKQYVEYGVGKGYINGYEDGTFKPDKTVTRAEFSKMLNTAVGIKASETISFSDVAESDWFYNEIGKAVYAGYVTGYENGTFLPNNTISRQEAAVILYRITLPTDMSESLDQFNDKDLVDSWAYDAVSAMVAKGYMKGDQFSDFTPKNGLTRAQAAKIIYEFVENENIHNGDVDVTDASTYSEILFTDNVNVSKDDVFLIMDNCRILGKLTVDCKNFKAELSNTVVNNLENTSETNSSISAASGSEIALTTLKSASDLFGNGFKKVVLCGDGLSAGTVNLSGNFDSVSVQSSAVVRFADGTVKTVDIDKPISLMVQTGNIDNLNVNKEASGAVITLSGLVNVSNANSFAKASYMGEGQIDAAYNAVDGVTFAKQPASVTGKKNDTTVSGDSGNNAGDKTGNGLLAAPTVAPSSGKTNVGVASNIVVQFDEDVFDSEGNVFNSTYLKNNVSLHKASVAGTAVSFNVAVNSTKKFTVYPSSDLLTDTKYYLVINANAFSNANGDTNAQFSSYFTTASDSSSSTSTIMNGVTVSPANSSTGVDLDTAIKLTFSNSMYRPNGNALTSAYIQSSVIELRKGSLTGAAVDYTADINSTRKVITITPDKNLESNTKYYVVILANSIADANHNTLSKTSSYFTTANTLLAEIEPSNASTGISTMPEITVTLNEAVTRTNGTSVTASYLMGTALELHKGSATGTSVDFTATISSDKKTITLIPDEELAKSTKYYIVLNEGTLKGSGGALNEKSSVYFTTAASMAPIVAPSAGKTGVSTSTDITVTFTDPLYSGTTTSTRKPITSDYITENSVVLLRKNTTTGSIIDCEVTVSSDYRTITLKPKSELIADLKYYVIVKKSSLYNDAGKSNSASSTFFMTAEVLTPEFSPADGDDAIDVKVKPEIIFNEDVYRANGTALTASYIASNVIELHKGNDEDGDLVDFSVTLSSDKRTFIIKPDDDLEGETDYCIVVVGGSLVNGSKTENPKSVCVFTTDVSVSTDVVITPENKETDISTSTSVTLKFDSKLYRYGGGSVTKTYANENLEIRKGSTGGTLVEKNVEISSDGKTFTLTPKEPLAVSTTYYVKVLSGKFQYSDDTKVASKSYYFKTGDGKPTISAATVEDTRAGSADFMVTSDVSGILYVSAIPTTGSTVKMTTPVNSLVSTAVKLTGLAPKTTYSIEMYVLTADGTRSAVKKLSISTKAAYDVKVTSTTDTSVSFTVTANDNGKLTVMYEDTSTGEIKTKTSNIVISSGVTRSITISGLSPDTQYNIITSMVVDSGDADAHPVEIKTGVLTEKSTDYLALSKIQVLDEKGNVYEADIVGTIATVYMDSTEKVNVKVFTQSSATSIKINGRPTENEVYSDTVSLTSTGKEIPIVLSYTDTSKTYTLKIVLS